MPGPGKPLVSHSKYYKKVIVTRNVDTWSRTQAQKIKSAQKSDITTAPHQICNW